MNSNLLFASLALAAVGSPTAAWGQVHKPSTYPIKLIRIISPFAPGGSTDGISRLLAEKLPPRLGQPVIIDNRPGAGGSTGMEVAARAPADGYTLVVAPAGPWAVNQHLYQLSYDAASDFAMIIRLTAMPGLLVVHPSLPVRTVPELIALAKQKPGVLNYGSSGVGGWGHISAELFESMTKTQMTHVPYKGSAPALIDLIGGQIEVLFNTASTTVPHVKAGTLRALATTGASRMSALPNLPTVSEAGVPGYENTTWSAIGAPARTPSAIIERLNREIAAVLATSEVQDLVREQSSTTLGGTPEQARAFLVAEIAKYGKIIQEAGIRR